MNYRTVEILASGDQTDGAGTKIIDIRVKDIISRIMIYWQVTMAGSGMNAPQHKDISKIELVDGSDVLFSLDGGQAQALCIYDRKCDSMNYPQKTGGNSMASNYAIDFGRFLHDPMLAFDPKRFNNPQLKITYDEDVADTGATENELGVKAEVFDEKMVTPMGFLMSKEIFKITPPTSGYTYIDLPTDHIMRKLLIQGYRAAYEPWNTVGEARLDEDNDKRVIFDWDLQRYYRMMHGVWRPVEEAIVCDGSDTEAFTYYITPTDYYTFFAGICQGSDYVYRDTVRGGGSFKPISYSTARTVVGMVKGLLPNHCFEFPFGDPKDIDDWFDVTKVGTLRLRLKAGSTDAAGNYAVVTQQLRHY